MSLVSSIDGNIAGYLLIKESKQNEVSSFAQKKLQEARQASSDCIYDHVETAGLAVLAVAAVVTSVYLGAPLYVAIATVLAIAMIAFCMKDDRIKISDSYENGSFTAQSLETIGRDEKGTVTPFKDFFEGYPYLYRLADCPEKEGEEYSETLFRKYVEDVLGVNDDPVAHMQKCLNDPKLRNKALQLHAFLQLIGNKNYPNSNANPALIEKYQLMLDPFSVQPGKVEVQPFGDECITFTVTGDKINLVTEARESVATYSVERTVTIFPPDAQGDVNYTISNEFF